jgi:ElaB/YqjD/DUF883 family membrane-anchored ribosome-binding protein
MESPHDRTEGVATTLRALISKSDQLLAAIGEEGAERYRDAAVALQREIRHARDRLADLQYAAVRRARLTARRADDYVHENPWKSAAAAAAAGAAAGALIVGLLLNRSEGSRGESGSDSR